MVHGVHAVAVQDPAGLWQKPVVRPSGISHTTTVEGDAAKTDSGIVCGVEAGQAGEGKVGRGRVTCGIPLLDDKSGLRMIKPLYSQPFVGPASMPSLQQVPLSNSPALSPEAAVSLRLRYEALRLLSKFLSDDDTPAGALPPSGLPALPPMPGLPVLPAVGSGSAQSRLYYPAPSPQDPGGVVIASASREAEQDSPSDFLGQGASVPHGSGPEVARDFGHGAWVPHGSGSAVARDFI